MGYLDAPYTGLHNEPYPQPPPQRPAERGWWGGLLDETAKLPEGIKQIVLDAVTRQPRTDPTQPVVTPGPGSLLDLTPVPGFTDAYKASDDVGKGGYEGGKAVGTYLSGLLGIIPTLGKIKKVPFETKAPGGGGFWSDLSKTVYPTSVEDMRFTTQPNGLMLPRKIVDIQDLQGGLLQNAVGDRTAAGQTLTHVGDKPLAFPVSLEGGPDFQRGPSQVADKAIWAADKGQTTAAVNKALELKETGKPVYLTFSGMGARSGDFSHHMAETLLAQMPGADVSKTARRQFDVEMRKINKDWPGIDNTEQARELLRSDGGMRKAFVEEMALNKWQMKKFPEIATSRAAITEPSLLREPTGASGYAISRVDNPSLLATPTAPHTTYPTQFVGGTYLGGTDVSLPRDVLWRDFYAQRRAEGKPVGSDDRAFSLSNVSQAVDQQLVDDVKRYQETLRLQGS